jgi:hypothetical protein
MTLPVFDSLESVPEPFRPFYKEQADGKVAADFVPGGDVVGLKKKNADLLANVAAMRAQYADVDVTEYQNLKANAGKGADLDARLKVSAENEKKALERADKLAQRMRDQAKRAEITAALSDAGVSVALLGPVVSSMVDVEENGDDLHVVVRDPASGQVRFKDSAGNRLTVKDLLSELREKSEYAPAFPQKVGSGGGAPVNSGNPAAGVRTISASDRAAVAKAVQSGDIRAGKVKIVA